MPGLVNRLNTCIFLPNLIYLEGLLRGLMTWPFHGPQAADMPDELRRILRFVMQLFARFGFMLNLEKGKTSAVVSFRGTRAPQMRQTYQLGPRPGDTFDVENRQVFLHYVSHYKHLGTSFAINHGLDVEIQQRIGRPMRPLAKWRGPYYAIDTCQNAREFSFSTP
jgi:hypothetical protein